MKTNLKARNQIISLLQDEILQHCERKIKVVSKKDDKNKLIILRTIVLNIEHWTNRLNAKLKNFRGTTS